MARPTLFIGSSTEGLGIARAIQIGLEHDCEVTLWNQGAFGLGQGTLESLVRLLDRFDFAILVLTPDDLVKTRGQAAQAPRDNVLFELGLFMGGIGRDRTFVVHDRTAPLKLPSDLAGVTTATFEPYSDGNLEAALGVVCAKIAMVVKILGSRPLPAHQVTVPKRVIGVPPTIMVTGGRDMTDTRAPDAAYEFGRLIAEQDVRLLSGVAKGVDEHFCRGVNDAASANGAEIKHILKCYTTQGRSPNHRYGKIVASKLKSRQEGIPELISECDIAVTFGGGRNTNYLGILALLEGRVLLPVDSTGGASSVLHSLVASRFDSVFAGRLDKRLFEDLSDLNLSAVDVAKVCGLAVDAICKSG